LAREPAADGINGNSVSRKSIGCKGSDIVIAGDFRPMVRENRTAIRIDFAEGFRFELAAPLKAKRKAANDGKQIEQLEPAYNLPRKNTRQILREAT
jgi:hypothetical protein